eukprot:jgi/Mesvir1/17973/Mv09866-RA.1
MATCGANLGATPSIPGGRPPGAPATPHPTTPSRLQNWLAFPAFLNRGLRFGMSMGHISRACCPVRCHEGETGSAAEETGSANEIPTIKPSREPSQETGAKTGPTPNEGELEPREPSDTLLHVALACCVFYLAFKAYDAINGGHSLFSDVDSEGAISVLDMMGLE